VEALRSWGVDIRGRGQSHKLPVRISADGRLKGGTVAVDSGVTSQVISSLLIAAPFAEQDTTIRLSKKLVSRPYVDITMDVLKWAGIKVQREGYKTFRVKAGRKFSPRSGFTVHGDYSSAAFLLAAACLVDSHVTVTDLVNDCQGDRAIIRILRAMGANVNVTGDTVAVTGPCALHGIEVDGSDTPDLVPVLAMLGCFASGTTRIRNVGHLVYKESNRLARPAGELKKLGARISFSKDEMVIRHSNMHGGRVSGCGDHRIAMALAVAGLEIAGGVTIAASDCIAKSYPGFVRDMKTLGANCGYVTS
jgi:3-phosphoshikimate 1-carboxyvinyltransferase